MHRIWSDTNTEPIDGSVFSMPLYGLKLDKSLQAYQMEHNLPDTTVTLNNQYLDSLDMGVEVLHEHLSNLPFILVIII